MTSATGPRSISGGYVSVSGMHVFTPKTFDGKVVEGKLATRKPDEFMNKAFEGKATIAFLKAARTGDKVVIRKTMTAEAAKGLDGPQAKEMLELLKMTSPDPATARIDAVDVKGNTAEVTVVEESKDGSVTSTFHLTLEGGQWKVSGG
jgi:Putative lumazine-binding